VSERWNIMEDLVDEKEIADFLEAAVEEGDDDLSFFLHCLPKALTARAINHIVPETSVDRKTLCDMFLEDTVVSAETIKAHADSILRVAKTFATPAHAYAE